MGLDYLVVFDRNSYFAQAISPHRSIITIEFHVISF